MPISPRSLLAAPLVAAFMAAGIPTTALAATAPADVGALSAARITTPVAAALIVGGTSFPTVSADEMAQIWPAWNAGLGLSGGASPALISVPYPAQLGPITRAGDESLGVSVAAGVTSLLGLLGTTYSAGEHLIVWGISQGALVLNQAQIALAADPAAPPASAVTFVRVADPAAAGSGVLRMLPDAILSGLLHTPTTMRTPALDSQYNTVVVTSQYDGFADFPDRPWNLLATANAIAGLYYRHGQTGSVDLETVPAQNITTMVNSLGATTTTFLVPCPYLPLTQPLLALGATEKMVDRIDQVLRPIVDAGYVRNDPVPTPAPPVYARSQARAVAQVGEAHPVRTLNAQSSAAAGSVSAHPEGAVRRSASPVKRAGGGVTRRDAA